MPVSAKMLLGNIYCFRLGNLKKNKDKKLAQEISRMMPINSINLTYDNTYKKLLKLA